MMGTSSGVSACKERLWLVKRAEEIHSEYIPEQPSEPLKRVVGVAGYARYSRGVS